MAFVVLPVIKQFLLCDDVVGDPVSGKPHLVNLFDAVRAPHGAEWPYTLKKACLFAWFREGMGRVTFRFELSRLSDYELVAAPWQQVVEFIDPLRSTPARFRLPDVRFPMPGLYTFDIYANGEFLDDQRVRVVTTEAQ